MPADIVRSPVPDPEPTYSVPELCRSWAEVTGEGWKNILYRFGDWAITDAFPDDAFRVKGLPHSTFHKKVIFDRVRWHRDLTDKIGGAQDPNEKDRVQKFADLHMKTVEKALMRRNVVVEACRAMNVVPPPILGLVEGVSAEHRAPPECPLHPPVGVFAREAERDQKLLRHRDVMSADEAEKHVLLWDAAAKMSRGNGRSLGWSWLRLMDGFWRGDLSPDGLVYFYPGEPGREFARLKRRALAGLLLGHRSVDARAASIEELRHWRVKDYLSQPEPFADYFQADPEGRFGLAVLTSAFDRWRHRMANVSDMAVVVGEPVTPSSGAAPSGADAKDQSFEQRASNGGLDPVVVLEDWIFKQRGQQLRGGFEKLCTTALNDSSLGTFKKKDFLAAYQNVYGTKSGRPPATGWPLRPAYAKRAEEEKSSK